jgi:hypothetical protein
MSIILRCSVCNIANKIAHVNINKLSICGVCGSPLIDRPDNIIFSIHNTILNDRCVICDFPANADISLTNGKVYHKRCHDRLLQALRRIEDQISIRKGEIHTLNSSLEKASSTIYKLRGWIFGKQMDVPDILSKMEKRNTEIIELQKLSEQISNNLQMLYDYWPTYPPDWEMRRHKIKEERQFCEECGNHRGPLHVHHIIPISKGGNHKPENLKLLCEDSHREKHGGRDFTYSNDGNEPSGYSRRLSLLRDAITKGQTVHFSYTRYDGVQSVRSIIPQDIRPIEDTVCVSGYCYLRKEKRTFAVKRMKNVRISDGPGRCYHK